MSRAVAIALLTCCAYFVVVYAQGTAYGTYHLYNADDPIGNVACSNGVNGIGTRWGYTDLSPMFPYIAAWNEISWNSPNCGTCILLNTSTTSIFITAIDLCGAPPSGYNAHFDIAQPAFVKLFGQAGINSGHGVAEWSKADASHCQGNKG